VGGCSPEALEFPFLAHYAHSRARSRRSREPEERARAAAMLAHGVEEMPVNGRGAIYLARTLRRRGIERQRKKLLD